MGLRHPWSFVEELNSRLEPEAGFLFNPNHFATESNAVENVHTIITYDPTAAKLVSHRNHSKADCQCSNLPLFHHLLYLTSDSQDDCFRSAL